MNLPHHINLTIEHQPHAICYETVEQWLESEREMVEPSANDRAEMIRTGEVWLLNWCPDTPVGSCCVVAATLGRALKLAGCDDEVSVQR